LTNSLRKLSSSLATWLIRVRWRAGRMTAVIRLTLPLEQAAEFPAGIVIDDFRLVIRFSSGWGRIAAL
jgi:hypothetical protein